MYALRKVITVSWFVFLYILITGHWLFLSTSINIYGVEGNFLLCRFQVNPSWISSPGVFGGFIFFRFGVSEILGSYRL